MNKLTITKIDIRPTKTGGKFAIASTRNEQGVVHENVTIFSSRPGFDTLAVGVVTEGELTPNDYNGRTGWKLNAPKGNLTGQGFRKSPAAISKAMEVKAENIKVAQEHKADGIKVAGTARDATLITVALIGKQEWSLESFKEQWLEVRSWLWQNWDFNDDMLPPF